MVRHIHTSSLVLGGPAAAITGSQLLHHACMIVGAVHSSGATCTSCYYLYINGTMVSAVVLDTNTVTCMATTGAAAGGGMFSLGRPQNATKARYTTYNELLNEGEWRARLSECASDVCFRGSGACVGAAS